MQQRSRWQRLAEQMAEATVDARIVTHLPDVRYLSGFTGSNAALAILRTGKRIKPRLFTDGRYTEQARQETSGLPILIVKGSAALEAALFLARAGATDIGFEPPFLTVAAHRAIAEALRKSCRASGSLCRFRPVSTAVSALRHVKDEDEQKLLARAAAVGCDLYEQIIAFIQPGMREIDIAAELEYRARKAGAQGMSFDTIVAAGVRSSMPHAQATTAKVRAGEMLTLDFGIMLDGYCSDMTRTLCVGKGGTLTRKARQREVFDAVLAAQQAALGAVREGVPVLDVDRAARGLLHGAGLAKWFTHSTGHGLGLEIHEGPRIADKQPDILRAGMVVTIEPGIYLPGEFGVRIEDTVLVTKSGCKILTPAYKGWLEL